MTEKELIAKIRKLRQIKPQKDWVVLTKSSILNQGFRRAVPTESGIGQILGEEIKQPAGLSMFNWLNIFPLKLKPVFAGLVILFIFLGGFYFVKNSLPGDALYSIRKAFYKGQGVLVSEEERPFFQLKLAEKRLDDLSKVRAKNLAPALNEFQTSVSEAAKSISAIETVENLEVIERIVAETKRLEEKKEIARALGVVIEDKAVEELKLVVAEKEREFYRKQVESIIKNLEDQALLNALTKEQEQLLAQIKKLVEEEQFQKAFELYLINQ